MAGSARAADDFVDLTGDCSAEHFDVSNRAASAGTRLSRTTRLDAAALQADLHGQSDVDRCPRNPRLSFEQACIAV